jgi:hypothetical protein
MVARATIAAASESVSASAEIMRPPCACRR